MKVQKSLLDVYRDELRAALGRGGGRAYNLLSLALDKYGEGELLVPDETVKVWSDLHIGHANIIRYCDRPFHNVGEMDAALWANWQSDVEPHETLVCVGDICFGSQSERLAAQHGQPKILVVGNHDLRRDGTLRVAGFDQVWSLLTTRGNPPLIFTHAPLPNVPAGYVNIHGHRHEKIGPPESPHINVSVEQLEYRPIVLTRLRRLAQAILANDSPDGDTTLERVQEMEM